MSTPVSTSYTLIDGKKASEAIKEKIERDKKHSLLVEGYQSVFQEDIALTKEYEAADFESL